MPKIMATVITAIVVLVAVLVMTKAGRDIDAATQRFMLYYAGVLALVGLTGSVLLGLVATDRIVMTPGHRVMAQAVHRAFSFGTLAFLIIHIVTEILAQRSHVIDAVVPFLSPYRTFYIGLGTIASDLIVLLVVTSILRKRFTAHGKAWRWRAIHYASYVAFVFAVLHGLLGGRTAKPYVDWSYGFAIAVTALGLAVRFLAISLRPKESLPSSPSADRARPAGSSSLHAAAMSMAHAQLGSNIGGTVQVLPAGLGGRGATDSWAALPVPGRSPASGPLPALGAAPAYAGPPSDAYHDLGFTPLGAPPYGDGGPVAMRGRPYVSADQPRPALARPARQPLYEPGYDGPPRFEGAPTRTRRHTPGRAVLLSVRTGRPQAAGRVTVSRGLPGPSRIGRASHPARPDGADAAPGRHPRAAPGRGPEFRPDSPAQNRFDGSAGHEADAPPGYWPAAAGRSGAAPRNGMGPGTGPMPRAGTGPMPRADSGPMPRLGTGPMPRPDTGPLPRRPDTGPLPRAGQGQPPRNGLGPDTGPMPRAGTGPMPRADSGPMPRLGTGPMPRFGTGPMPRPDIGGTRSRPATGPMPPTGTGPLPRPDTGPMPRPGPMPQPDQPWSAGEPATGPSTGPSRAARRGSHRAKHTDPRYRDMPGPTGGDEWR